VQRLRRLRVAHEDERVVLEPAHELDHVQVARERDVGHRSLVGVVALVEEDEIGRDLVEHRLRRERRRDRLRQQLLEQRASERVAGVDGTLVQVAGDRRQHLPADVRPVERRRLQLRRKLDTGEQLLRLALCRVLHPRVEEVLQRDEPLDPEHLKETPRNLAVPRHRHDDVEPGELERLREHPLELQLVRRVAEARDERRPARLRRRPAQHLAVVAPERPEVELQSGSCPQRAPARGDRCQRCGHERPLSQK